MVYAKVENGQIVEVGQCPRNTELTSNFYLLDDTEKKLQNWFKIIEDIVSTNEWEFLGQSTYEFRDNEVYETKVINTISLDEYKTKVYSDVANNTKNYVMSITPDYKQLSALAGNYPIEECDKIKAFAKKHVDEVRALKILIFNASTYEEVRLLNKNVKFDYDTLEPMVETIPRGL